MRWTKERCNQSHGSAYKNPPKSPLLSVDVKTQPFVSYFDVTYKWGVSTRVAVALQQLGSQTMNLTKGFHNGINCHFGVPHHHSEVSRIGFINASLRCNAGTVSWQDTQQTTGSR